MMRLTGIIAAVAALSSAMLSCSVKLDLEGAIRDGGSTAVVWMEDLPDDRPLSQLSIPGAHDAASSSITAWSAWTRTQELNVAELWNAGVRAFDLRPAWVDGELGLFHDRYSAHVSLPEVISALLLALDTHPGECAVVIIRHEEEADGNADFWKDAMGDCLGRIRGRLVDYSPSLTLGQMRGKILVLSRSPYTGGPIGGYIRNWSHGRDLAPQKGAAASGADGTWSPLWVQDYYHPDGADDKWAAVKGLLDAAGEDSPLLINHTSGYVGTLPDYASNARDINGRAADYISLRGRPTGIVMMDYAGVDRAGGKDVCGARLVRTLIDNN